MITIVVVLVVIGLLLHLLNKQEAIDPTIKTIINVVIILALCIWLLGFGGINTKNMNIVW